MKTKKSKAEKYVKKNHMKDCPFCGAKITRVTYDSKNDKYSFTGIHDKNCFFVYVDKARKSNIEDRPELFKQLCKAWNKRPF